MHDHHSANHHHHHDSVKNITIALVLNLSFAVVEIVGGILTGSVAILADALHDFGDSFSLAMALVFERLAKKSPDSKFSYGYRRLSLLSALLTALILVTGSVAILYYAILRLRNPIMPELDGMLFLAILGVLVNGLAAYRINLGSTLNEQVLTWHFVEDVFGWLAILIASIVMRFIDLPILDPILSILFTLWILKGVVGILRKTFDLFMQATPHDIDIPRLCRKVLEISSIRSVHDVHLWSLDGSRHVMTMHAVMAEPRGALERDQLLRRIREVVASYGDIHLTCELESLESPCISVSCSGSDPLRPEQS